jgi:hypothetical protein
MQIHQQKEHFEQGLIVWKCCCACWQTCTWYWKSFSCSSWCNDAWYMVFNNAVYICFRNSRITSNLSSSKMRVRTGDSAVGIATGWRQRGRSSSPGRVKNFLFSTSTRLVLGPTQPPIQPIPGVLSPEVKRPEREEDSSPTSAEVKKTWIYTSGPPYIFMA